MEIYNLELASKNPRIVINMPLEAAEELLWCLEEPGVINSTLAKLLKRVISSTESNTYAQEYMEKTQ